MIGTRIHSALWLVAGTVTAAACSSSGASTQDDSNSGALSAADGGAPGLANTADGGAPLVPGTPADRSTRSPIKHVIVIVGENRTFDHVYATYKPKKEQRVLNLLSRGIIKEDGSPGPNYWLSAQRSAVDTAQDGYKLSPGQKQLYKVLPPALAGGPKTPYVSTDAEAAAVETGLPPDYVHLLTTGGTGLKSGTLDTRIPHADALPPGPFQLTPGIGYDDYSASPVHRFYQMWQQLDCSAMQATWENPSGCRSDLFPWVETSVGAGSNGNPQPKSFDDTTTGEGSTSMGFYNVLRGDAPYFKYLADEYAMSDNFHQSIQGGTGANHITLGTGDAMWFSDGKGNALTPPALNTEDPNPQPGTNNYYTQDGYSGGSYTGCADETQPAVGAVTGYLHAVHVNPNCEKGHYYLLNNYAPGYFGDGSVNTDKFAIPPSSVRTIGDALLDHGVSWRYYGESWNRYVKDPTFSDPETTYCDICNPFQYATSIMANDAVRTEHIKDTTDLYDDVARGYLPAVSIVKPSGLVDGHPASSKLDLFEGFSKKIIDAVKANPALWQETAILVTFDEGGGYYDSGYVEPVDFFGDGTRIPLVAVSPWSTGGHISHHYSDHASILKFIERNWRLSPLTSRSRDNLPNPVADLFNPWVPRNGVALDDLFDLFDFGRRACDESVDADGVATLR